GQTILSGSLDKTVRFWKPGGMPFLTILRHETEVTGLAVSPDGKRIVSGTSSGKLYLWEQKGALLHSLNAHAGKIQDITFSRNSEAFATAGGDGAVKIWDRNGKLVKVLVEAGVTASPQQTVAFAPQHDANSPNGAYLVAGDNNGGNVILWDKNLDKVRTIPACKAIVGAVVFAPNSQTIATGCGDPLVKLWDTNGKLLKVFKGHQGTVRDIAFSPDGTQFVSVSVDGTAKLWQPDGKLLITFAQHKAPISSVAYTNHARYTNDADDALIASASTDRSVKLWRPDGTLMATFNGHTGSVNKVEFGAGGRNVISASTDHTVIVWDLNTVVHSDDVLKFGCEWIKGYLHNNSELPEGDRTLCDAAVSPSTDIPQ
ncbi:MAG TPA: WD40 repeat domain-containing protein, partial [Allocoleopsis sp.]